ncbi:hypothetical protein K2P97_08120 [bacterium]|nr:hypothetical protein [bacterium]
MEIVFLDVSFNELKKLIKQYFQLFTVVSLLTGCTSLSLINVIPEIESPTMQGNNGRIGFELAGVGGKELILVDDPSKRPVVFNKNNLKTSTTVTTRTGLSWYPTNNLAIAGGIQNSSALYLKGKLNVLNSYREDPELGLVYLSINFETTYQQARKSGDTNGVGGATGFPWEGTSQSITGAAGVSVGYQLFKRVVPFLGFSYQQIQTTGNVNQSQSLNGADAGGSYSLGPVDGTTQVIGFGLEYRPKNRFFITPLIQYFDFDWGGNKIKDVTGSIKITYVPL